MYEIKLNDMNNMNYFGGKNSTLFEIESFELSDIVPITKKVCEMFNIELKNPKEVKLGAFIDYDNFYLIPLDNWKTIQIIKK